MPNFAHAQNAEILLGSLHGVKLFTHQVQSINLTGPNSFTLSRIVISHCSTGVAGRIKFGTNPGLTNPNPVTIPFDYTINMVANQSATLLGGSFDAPVGQPFVTLTFSQSAVLYATDVDSEQFAVPCDVYVFGEGLP